MNNEILLTKVRIDASNIKSITFIYLKHQNTIKFFLLAMYFQYFISHINDFEYE